MFSSSGVARKNVLQYMHSAPSNILDEVNKFKLFKPVFDAVNR